MKDRKKDNTVIENIDLQAGTLIDLPVTDEIKGGSFTQSRIKIYLAPSDPSPR